MTAEDLSDEIATNAQGPAQAQGDEGSIRQHTLADQIAADRYLAAKDAVHNAASRKTFGVLFGRIRPPGAI